MEQKTDVMPRELTVEPDGPSIGRGSGDLVEVTQSAPAVERMLPTHPPRRPEVVRDLPAPPKPEPTVIMAHSEGELGDLFGALAEAQGEFGEIERTLQAKISSSRANYVYSYAPLDEVLQAVRPALSKHGLALMQFPFTRQSAVVVRTLVGHKSGQWIYNELLATTAGLDPQSVGTVITYLRRYGAQALLGVAPGYDDDAESQQRAARPEPKAAPRVSAQATAVAPAKVEIAPGAHVGRIEDVAEQNGVTIVKLSSGLSAGTRDPEIAEALKAAKGRLVDLTLKAPAASGYMPKILELSVAPESK